jgi:hypothetical protein
MKYLPLLVILIVSCNPVKRATEIMRNHPDKLVELCAHEFPPEPVSDSSAFKQSMARIDSLIAADSVQKQITESERNELIATIDRLSSQPIPDCDSLSDAVFRLAAKEKQRADKLERSNIELKSAVKNVKPVIEKIPDKAKEIALQNRINELIETVTLRDAEITKLKPWKGKARKRAWILWGVIVAATAWTFRKKLIKLV